MSLRKVRSPDAPKITTLHGCGIGRFDRPSRSGVADNSLLTEKGAEHGARGRRVANDFPPNHHTHEQDGRVQRGSVTRPRKRQAPLAACWMAKRKGRSTLTSMGF